MGRRALPSCWHNKCRAVTSLGGIDRYAPPPSETANKLKYARKKRFVWSPSGLQPAQGTLLIRAPSDGVALWGTFEGKHTHSTERFALAGACVCGWLASLKVLCKRDDSG